MPWRLGSECIDPHFLDLGPSWMLVVSFTSWQLYPQQQTHWIGGWVGPRASLDNMDYHDSNSDPLVVQPTVATPTVLFHLLAITCFWKFPYFFFFFQNWKTSSYSSVSCTIYNCNIFSESISSIKWQYFTHKFIVGLKETFPWFINSLL
jgi:hypothetical protein